MYLEMFKDKCLLFFNTFIIDNTRIECICFQPVLSRFQIPGDGVDNDKDGLVDEEYCGFLSEGELQKYLALHLKFMHHKYSFLLKCS